MRHARAQRPSARAAYCIGARATCAPADEHSNQEDAAEHEQRQHQNAREAFGQSEVRQQRGQPDAGGEAGERPQPARRARRGRRGSLAACAWAGAAGFAGATLGAVGGGGVTWRCAPRLRPPPRRFASAESAATNVTRGDRDERDHQESFHVPPPLRSAQHPSFNRRARRGRRRRLPSGCDNSTASKPASCIICFNVSWSGWTRIDSAR